MLPINEIIEGDAWKLLYRPAYGSIIVCQDNEPRRKDKKTGNGNR